MAFINADPQSTYVELADGYGVVRADRFQPGQLLLLSDKYPLLKQPTKEDPHTREVWLSVDSKGNAWRAGKEVIVMLVSVDALSFSGEMWATVLYDGRYLQVRNNHQILRILGPVDFECRLLE